MSLKNLFAAFIVSSACAAATASAEQQSLNLYNWSDYLAEDTLAKFTEQTGIVVNLTTYEEESEANDVLLSKSSDYDIVVIALDFMAEQLVNQRALFKPLKKQLLPNMSNLDPAMLAEVAGKDPFNYYGVPYLWGTIGIGYNPAMVNQRFNGQPPVDSWSLIFEVENIKKLSDCGVAFIDSPNEILPLIINYLGGEADTKHRSVYENLARERLEAIAPYVTFNTDYIYDLAAGEYCAVVGWSGNMMYAADIASEADNGVEILYSLPQEGASYWFDMLAIPVQSQNIEAAHTFINFMMQPEVIADVSNYLWYPNINLSAMPLIDDEILTDPNIYPTDEIKSKLYLLPVASKRMTKYQNALWQSADQR
ncbi:Putrescine-binding periplasmic protein SpuD [Sinobacterium norvegicum]|uniref:Putrescine-binding periplasmic protein n=1 Tax=Sinobacterium norvegicum TaxID=1641715 RepID=A0ABN8EHA7_9GAMM|nr:extracellular solute-binding protein [Sinobacterium norvegicum]CAH0991818.1 Putrescine-binding periplasmic protein SpuD [Sinobacterium norvegicum]